MMPSHLLKISLLCSCILFFLPLITLAQEPEQDCSGAILITSSPDTFQAYVDYGLIQELPDYPLNINCLLHGEQNSVWITFTVCDTSLLTFQVTPRYIFDDFDWVLYDFTNHTCADVLDSSNELRCNFSAIPGSTGLKSPYTLISVDAGGPNQCAPVHPYANQRFLLLVNNFAQDSGFILVFGDSITLCLPTDVPEIIDSHKFSLYPNPTDGKLQMKNLPAKNNLKIEVMNVYGNKVYAKELKGTGNNQISLPPLLPDGFYVLRVLEKGKLFGEEAFIISR